MDEMFPSLLENGTWELEKLPDGVTALPMNSSTKSGWMQTGALLRISTSPYPFSY
jgi:hypothetical protein